MENKQKASKSMAPRHDGEDGIPSLLAGGRPKSGMQTGLQGRLPAKGKVVKGTPFDFRQSNIQERSKAAQMESQLQDNNQIILMQKLEIRSLKDQLINLIGEREG